MRVRPMPLAAVGLLAALVVLSARGSLSRFASPVAPPPPAPAIFDPRLHCARVRTDAWSPLPGVEYTGRLGVRLPPSASGELVLVVGDDIPLDIEVESAEGVNIPVLKERLEIGRGAHAPPPDYWLENGTPWDAPGEAQRLRLLAAAEERVFSVRLGRRAPRVLARIDGYPKGTTAQVCAAPLGHTAALDEANRTVTIEPTQEDYFGTGWSGVEQDAGVGLLRRLAEHAALLVPSNTRGNVRIELNVLPGPVVAASGATLALRVNGVRDLGGHALTAGASVYTWEVPAGAWLEGTNELLFTLSGVAAPRFMPEQQARPFEIAVSRVRLTLVR